MHAYIHEQTTIEFGVHIVDLNWCTPFSGVSQSLTFVVLTLTPWPCPWTTCSDILGWKLEGYQGQSQWQGQGECQGQRSMSKVKVTIRKGGHKSRLWKSSLKVKVTKKVKYIRCSCLLGVFILNQLTLNDPLANRPHPHNYSTHRQTKGYSI